MPAKSDGKVDWESGNRTGPYVLEEFKPGQIMRAKRNPNYFRDTWFDEVEIISLIDPSSNNTLSPSAFMSSICETTDLTADFESLPI